MKWGFRWYGELIVMHDGREYYDIVMSVVRSLGREARSMIIYTGRWGVK